MTAADRHRAGTRRGGWVRRLLYTALLLISGGLLGLFATRSPGWQAQSLLAVVLLLTGLAMELWAKSRPGTVAILLVSSLAGWRYLVWRVHLFGLLLAGAAGHLRLLLYLPGLLFLLAETALLLSGALRYLVQAWPLVREPVRLPGDVELWPAVDVVIAVGDAPILQVRMAALAALHLDWPADRLRLHVLEQEGREELRRFCAARGMGYLVASRESLATGGILANFGEQLHAPFLALLEANQPPVRSFLQLTMGWFVRQPALGMLQTRQGGGSPPELNGVRLRCVEDLWDAVSAEGSAAVLRRSAWQQLPAAMESAGSWYRAAGLALQRRGWQTAYLALPQVATGLAGTPSREGLRMQESRAEAARWVLQHAHPLKASGLRLGQRLYLGVWAAEAFLPGPRLVCLLAPLGYGLLGQSFLPGSAAALALYAAPHLLLCLLARRRLDSSWRAVLLDSAVSASAVSASLLPFSSGAVVERPDEVTPAATEQGNPGKGAPEGLRHLRPAFLLCMLGLMVGVFGRVLPELLGLFAHQLAQPADASQLWLALVQVGWAATAVAALAIARELSRQSPQRRRSQRVPRRAAAAVLLPDGGMISRGESVNVSPAGIWVRCETALPQVGGERLQLELEVGGRRMRFDATVISAEGRDLRLHFRKLSPEQQEALAVAMYNRADSWLQLEDSRTESLWELVRQGLGSFVAGHRRAGVGRWAQQFGVAALAVTLVSVAWAHQRRTEPKQAAVGRAAAAPQRAREEASVRKQLEHVHGEVRVQPVAGGMVLDARNPALRLRFDLPTMVLAQGATLELAYQARTGIGQGQAPLRVMLNGAPVTASAAPAAPETATGGELGQDLTVSVPLSPEWLVQTNEITLELVGQRKAIQVAPESRVLWQGVLLRPAHPAAKAAEAGSTGAKRQTAPARTKTQRWATRGRLFVLASLPWLGRMGAASLLVFLALCGLYTEQVRLRTQSQS